MSAWCLVSGVEIAISKLRTFGKEWGVKKREGEATIVLLLKGGEKKNVEVKDEGLMTHLGIIWNMDMNGNKQWESIKETILRMGEEILRGKGRMRDKVMVINYCLKSTVLYRMQYCTWDLEKYKELDRTLNQLLRKVTKNMKKFPGGTDQCGSKAWWTGIEEPK